MEISIIGTGYVGLVTGVALSEVGHTVTCIDTDNKKIGKLKLGESPIHEPGLEELIKKNMMQDRLFFSSDKENSIKSSDIIYIAVGTPQTEDGSADLSYIEQVSKDIAQNVENDVIVVTKSTVPVGTNDFIRDLIQTNLVNKVNVKFVSNPEFLREGSAIYDTFHGDRIVIGSDDQSALFTIEEINSPFNIPIFKTDLRTSEMIKYASNAFLATKISFINEIANICEKVGANVEDVAKGMGKDQRIGPQFLNAGIGYGGSCFPKDTNALVQIAGNHEHDFKLLRSVIEVNQVQQESLVNKAISRFGNLAGKKIAMLGLAFKPNTDDMREAASIVIVEKLKNLGATITAYDPVALENAKKILSTDIDYVESLDEALKNADLALIVTEWEEIKKIDLIKFTKLMDKPIVFDGRNCFSLDEVKGFNFEYHSVGRPVVNMKLQLS